jgi:broad specificity phosphatase PhoE
MDPDDGDADGAPVSGRLLLVRHGQTEWSRTGRHTGRTDVPLTDEGEEQARILRSWVEGLRPRLVLASPLQRAHRTAELAGLPDVVLDPDLQEWDYGGYEGLTTPEIRERVGETWTVFKDGVVPGETPGESLEQLAARGRAVLERVRPELEHGDVVLVGHGHALRVLATCWLDADPWLGAQLLLDPATTSVLGSQHGVAAIVSWNVPATR